jgi:manganese transport protein
VFGLVLIVGVCFMAELWMAKPVLSEIAGGLIPRIDVQSLYVAIGILGATVMPHNLYLHSALVQTRSIGKSDAAKQQACRFNFIDSAVALNGALLVNGAILVLSASVFFHGGVEVTRIEQAHELLTPMLGTALSGILFGVALLAAGQSSTITGTLAGQIVMEGFLNLRMQPWLRRMLTRLLAIVPAILVIQSYGEESTYRMLILSQVILSLQLPFAVIPLIRFTSDEQRMGSFANPAWMKTFAWISAAIIVSLNLWLAWTTLEEVPGGWWWLPLTLSLAAIGLLLLYVTFEPWMPQSIRGLGRAADAPRPAPVFSPEMAYRRILVPLDHTDRDRDALQHATALAKAHGATLHLLHVEEDVTSQIYGADSSTAEVTEGQRYFDDIRAAVEAAGIEVHLRVVYAQSPRDAIVSYARKFQPDLIVMGAHGHRGLRDLVFGTTINAVRHHVQTAVLIVGKS